MPPATLRWAEARTKNPDAVETVKNALVVADAGDGKPVQCTHGP